MKYLLKFIMLFCLLYTFSCSNQREEEPEIEKRWKLTFEDEFNGDTIDDSKWETYSYNRRQNPNGPDGWWDKDDTYLSGDGELVIRVRKIDNKNSSEDSDSHDYSSGMIRSKGKFEQKFGKFEIRCKLPKQAGWWVAFWLFSESVINEDGSGRDGTEIDIFEGFGWTDQVQHALHYDGYGDMHKETGKRVNIPGIREGYHTYTLEWNTDEYIFFIDGKETWRTSYGGVSQVPAYVKVTGEISTLDWAINDWWANDPYKAEYPDYFLIDYVKVYEKME